MVSNHFSKADRLYRKFVRNTFFSKGWGSVETYRGLQRLKKDLFNAEKFREIVLSERIKIDKVTQGKTVNESFSILDGHFLSPLARYYPGLLPKESEVAYFQAIIPSKRKNDGKMPMCIQLAGTGDHQFWRRRNLVAKPLVKDYLIGSLLLMNPFYGSRKPKSQTRSSLNHVVDLLLMGCALIIETSVLINWCEEQGFGPLAVTGVSMGGHMASIAGTFVPKPITIIPCLACTTASAVFTKGVLSNAVAWSTLQNQLQDSSFFEELQSICRSIEIDGISARNLGTCPMNSTFPHELMNVFNNPTNISFMPAKNTEILQDMTCGNEPSHQHYNHCESISFTMLIKSLKSQVRNNMRNIFPKEVVSSYLSAHATQPKTFEKAKNLITYLLDVTTHLGYYRRPVDPQKAVFVQAQFDGYMPNMDCPSPVEVWPGSNVEFVNCGHIFAALYKQDVFRKIISDMLNKA